MNRCPSRLARLAEFILEFESMQNEKPSDAFEVSIDSCAKLRLPLSRLAGNDGYQSLLSRSLQIAQIEEPKLNQLYVDNDGILVFLKGKSHVALGELHGCGRVLITQLFGLMVTFIGESLTFNTLQSVWPAELILKSDDKVQVLRA